MKYHFRDVSKQRAALDLHKLRETAFLWGKKNLKGWAHGQ